MSEFKTITKPVIRHDNWDKVTGKAQYAGDISMPGMLHMKLVFARRPHARIQSIDLSAAINQPGVETVLTASDVPYNRYGLGIPDQPVFCEDKVRFVGDRICAVVAQTAEQAAHAAELVGVIYQDLPILSDPLQATQNGAMLIHEDHPGNIAHAVRLRRGNAEAALAQADVVIEREYHTPMQEHAFLEPEAGVGYIDEQGRVTILCAGQWTHEDRRQIAKALCMPAEQVRVVYGPIGGAFGGREDISIQIVLALAAWKLGRPVKITWTREESILGHGKRHAMIMRHKWGARRDGTLVAAIVEVISDAGAYLSTSDGVLNNFRFSSVGSYNIPNVSLDGRAVFTNNPPGCAMRGFGSPQATFAAELQIEHIAEELGMDPITIRLRNCLHDNSILPTQAPVPGGVSLVELVEACARRAGIQQEGNRWYFSPLQASQPHKRRGLGLAIGMKNSGFPLGMQEGSEARVVLHGVATIERADVYTAVADVGQGAHSVLTQIAAEVLNLPIERINMITSDTAQCGDSGAASASRVTMLAGNAVKRASELALERWANEDRPAAEAFYRWEPAIPTTAPHPNTGACNCALSFSYGAQIAEVEVDIETGEVDLVKVTATQDPGLAVNPTQVVGQMQGGIVQAQGWSLIEDFITDNGRVLTDRFSTYLIPTTLDVPVELDTVLIEKPDPLGPYGVRGAGEMPFVSLAPAVVIAIHNATGLWFDHIPVKAEQILARLHEQVA